MKATTLLEQQHRKVKAIFKKLESKNLLTRLTAPDPKALVQELASDLNAHMAIEHEIFYPAVFELDEDMIRESVEEHALAELALKRLMQTSPRSDAFHARVTACRELIDHHVEEEEEFFKKAEKKLGSERLEQLGKEMKARFQQLTEKPVRSRMPRGFEHTLADNEREQATGTAAPVVRHARRRAA